MQRPPPPMDPHKADQLRAIFDEAAERPEAERAGFVHSACGSDAGLELEMLSLLSALGTGKRLPDADAGTWLIDGIAESEGSSRPLGLGEPLADLHGEIVGDFRLLRAIGKGATG